MKGNDDGKGKERNGKRSGKAMKGRSGDETARKKERTELKEEQERKGKGRRTIHDRGGHERNGVSCKERTGAESKRGQEPRSETHKEGQTRRGR